MVIIAPMQPKRAANAGLMARLKRTGFVPTCIGDLKSTQERIHINECQFRATVHEFGIQIVVHVERIRWSPRRGRFPQTAMLQNFLNYFVLGWVNKTDYFHFATALRTDHGINFIHSLDQHGPGLAAANWSHG